MNLKNSKQQEMKYSDKTIKFCKKKILEYAKDLRETARVVFKDGESMMPEFPKAAEKLFTISKVLNGTACGLESIANIGLSKE